jgi:transcriptional regulator with XRE-family HTH domain
MPRRNQTSTAPPRSHRASRLSERQRQLADATEPLDDDVRTQNHDTHTSMTSGATAPITQIASSPQAASEIGQRLRSIRTRAGLTVRALAEMLDLAPTTVQSWEGRATTKPLPPEVVARMSAAVLGRGNPPVTQNELTALAAWWSTEPVSPPTPNAQRQRNAPWPAAHPVRIIAARAIAWGVMKMDTHQTHTNTFAVVMQDNSMAPRYDAGDLIYCDPNRPPAIGAYAIAITSDGAAYVGQLADANPHQTTLRTLNPPQDRVLPTESVTTLARILTTAEIVNA